MNILLNAIIPVFGIMLLGTAASVTGVLGESAEKSLSKFVYFFALPSVLFISTAQTPLSNFFNGPFVIAYSLGTIITFSVFLWLFFKYGQKREAVIRALAVASPNTAFMGIPVIMVLFGNKGMLAVVISTIILSFIVCVSVIMLEFIVEPKNLSIIKLMKKIIIKNPIIFSIIIGFVLSALKIKPRTPISELFSLLGSTCGPCAMFAIGMTLVLKIPKRIIPKIIIVNVAKLMLMPAIVFVLLLLLGASPLMTATGLILSAMPVAATTFIIAQQYEISVQESSDMVLSSTIASIITLSVAILIVSRYFPATLLS